MGNHSLNAVHDGVYTSDNVPFLQERNDQCIDLVCIHPPVARSETLGRKNGRALDPLKPLTEYERDIELPVPATPLGHPQRSRCQCGRHRLASTRYKDLWSWADVHEQ